MDSPQPDAASRTNDSTTIGYVVQLHDYDAIADLYLASDAGRATRRRIAMLAGVAMFVLCACSSYLFSTRGGGAGINVTVLLPGGAISLVVGLAMALWSWTAFRRRAVTATRLQVTQGNATIFLGPRVARVDAAGLHVRTPGTRAMYAWHVIQAVIATRAHVLFQLGASTGVVVPRATATGGDFDEFVRLAQAHWIARHGDVPTAPPSEQDWAHHFDAL